jgi:hypothetical protein
MFLKKSLSAFHALFLAGSAFGLLFIPSILYAREYSIPLLAKLSAASVVKIWGAGAAGSGVIVSMPKEDGTGRQNVIFTAYHVISGLGDREFIEIEFPDGEFLEISSKSIVKVGNHDLALISLPENLSTGKQSFKVASVGNSNNIGLGDKILVAGYPLESESNVSNRVRIKPGVVQTFSSTNKGESYVGYDAKTLPGMSGGGVFSIDGKLMLIHLKGEKDLWNKDILIDGRPLKSGTNYGIPALLALKEAQAIALKNFNISSPLEEFKKGLYLLENGRKQEALKVFSSLSDKYPDSLIAEWNAACLKLELSPPLSLSQQIDLERKFWKKNKIKSVYGIPFTSDSMIWDESDRSILLSYDPIFKLAKKAGEFDYKPTYGRYVSLTSSKNKCERMVGLTSYRDASGQKVIQWKSIHVNAY